MGAFFTALKDNHGRIFTKRAYLERICFYFYRELYGHKNIFERALRKVLDNIVLTQETLHWAKTCRQPTNFLRIIKNKNPLHSTIRQEVNNITHVGDIEFDMSSESYDF